MNFTENLRNLIIKVRGINMYHCCYMYIVLTQCIDYVNKKKYKSWFQGLQKSQYSL